MSTLSQKSVSAERHVWVFLSQQQINKNLKCLSEIFTKREKWSFSLKIVEQNHFWFGFFSGKPAFLHQTKHLKHLALLTWAASECEALIGVWLIRQLLAETLASVERKWWVERFCCLLLLKSEIWTLMNRQLLRSLVNFTSAAAEAPRLLSAGPHALYLFPKDDCLRLSGADGAPTSSSCSNTRFLMKLEVLSSCGRDDGGKFWCETFLNLLMWKNFMRIKLGKKIQRFVCVSRARK